MGRLPSLSANHPIRALLSRRLAGDALPAHPRSIAGMRKGLKAKTQGSLMEVDCDLPDMANAMDVFAAEARLGHCLVDCHSVAIRFDISRRTLTLSVLVHCTSASPCQASCMAWLASSGRTHSCSPLRLMTNSQVHPNRTRTGGTNLLGWLSCEYTSALQTLRSLGGSHLPCTPIPLCCSLPLVFGRWLNSASSIQDTPHILCLLDLGLPMKAWMALGSNGQLSRTGSC